MTSIDCFSGPTHAIALDECAARCLHCGSTAIRDEVEYIHCLDCDARESDVGIFPALDALDSLTEYYAEAPLGEPPAVVIWDAPVRKPVQQPNRKRSAVA